MTQSIVIQVGQCGNQIGCRFWDLALREHATYNKKGIFDESLSSFFRNVDARYSNPLDLGIGDGKQKITSLKARAVLIDMEEGVVNELLKGSLRDVFDHRQLLTDVSGCGNNWAVGHKLYGSQYQEQLEECIRTAAECCDCLQCFFIMHSMGGGTGSGVGTAVLSQLQDLYPDVYRFVTAVYPSSDDDVITSPYNSVLAMRQLTDCADCVMPIENQALYDICQKVYQAQPQEQGGKRTYPAGSGQVKGQGSVVSGAGGATKAGQEKPFDHMNNIVANLLLNLTSSSRFEGSLNVDLNEISTNLVPFPRLHYLVTSQTPLYTSNSLRIPARRLDQMFTDAFSRENQLLKADPKNSMYLACALMCRGNVQVSDIRRNIDRLRPSLNFIHWNTDGWKTGLCSVPPVGHPYSLLTMANNTCLKTNFSDLRDRFNRLYKRKAHIHHYTSVEGMDTGEFKESLESLSSLIEEYQKLETAKAQPVPRLNIAT
ncbi:tubulin epsilon chain-like [Lytechinus variegatus]|uniref:tubulin epsilon chain-like n=1 Tax=Lytechinus variegatus TaxID=7654 RepID=UPI001BB0E06B|nr:tubulin epsilon chain-like [Lytechinus variegatus]